MSNFFIVCDYAIDFLGGAQTALIQQATALVHEGHQVTVVAPRAREVWRENTATLRVIELPRTVHLPGIDLYLPLFRGGHKLLEWMGDLLDEHTPRAVLIHSELGLAAAALKSARSRKIPVLHTVHTFFWSAPAAGGIIAPVVRALHRSFTGFSPPTQPLAKRALDSALRGMTWAVARNADLVISPSFHQAEALTKAGVQRVQVISNTVEQATTEPKELPQNGPLKLAWVGRFSPEKRLATAVDALAIVVKTLGTGRVTLEVVGGTGPAAPDLTFHGRLANKEATRVMTESHALVLTSVGFDNQPMVALEAFRAGRPIVVSDPVLAREFGSAAIAAKGTDAEGLAATILELVNNRSALPHHAAAASAYVRDCSPQRHVAAILTALDTLDGIDGIDGIDERP